MSRRIYLLISFLLLAVILIVLSLAWGSVATPADVWRSLLSPHTDSALHRIVWELRFPRVASAILAGSALGVSGLLLQTFFRNPLAGPQVLGISSGASLGVALLMLGGVGGGQWGLLVAGALGSGVLLLLVLFLARWVKSPVSLMVMGLMVGYLVDSVVGVLMFFASPEQVQAYIGWSFGSFGRIGRGELPLFGGAVLVGGGLALFSTRFLNASLLGEEAARTLGLALRPHRVVVLGAAALLAAAATVHCGPVAFLGLAVPHLGRGLLRTANHRWLLPACVLLGMNLALFAGFVAQLPGQQGVLPLNAVMALLGAPVVLWILFPRRGRET